MLNKDFVSIRSSKAIVKYDNTFPNQGTHLGEAPAQNPFLFQEFDEEVRWRGLEVARPHFFRQRAKRFWPLLKTACAKEGGEKE